MYAICQTGKCFQSPRILTHYLLTFLFRLQYVGGFLLCRGRVYVRHRGRPSRPGSDPRLQLFAGCLFCGLFHRSTLRADPMNVDACFFLVGIIFLFVLQGDPDKLSSRSPATRILIRPPRVMDNIDGRSVQVAAYV